MHFPISLFGAAFGFQLLHLFFAPECFTLASTVALTAGALMMIPTTATGYRSWRIAYRGARTPLFARKIRVALLMTAASAALAGWRLSAYSVFREEPGGAHWAYAAGTILLIAGAVAEGYLGGRLHHAD